MFAYLTSFIHFFLLQLKNLSRFYQTLSPSDPALRDLASGLKQVARDLKIKTLDEWYKINPRKHSALLAILTRHSMPLFTALSKVYPEHEFLPWKFKQVPRGYWLDIANQRSFFDWALNQLPRTAGSPPQLSDWYNATVGSVKALGGTGPLSRHGDSLILALKTSYPEHNFIEWKFKYSPFKFWQKTENRRRFLEALAEEMGQKISDTDFLYTVTNEMIEKAGGRGLVANTPGCAVSTAIMSAFPEHSWKPWRFHVTPVGWWDSTENQRRYIKEELIPYLTSKHQSSGHQSDPAGSRDLEILYTATVDDFASTHGSSLLLSRYQGSIRALAHNLFPEHTWEERFSHHVV